MGDKPQGRPSGLLSESRSSTLDEPAIDLLNDPTIPLLNQPADDLVNVRVPDEVIRGWRRSLVDANAQILQTVSGSMAQTIAAGMAIRLPDVTLAVADVTLDGMGDQLTPYLTRVTRDLTAELQRFVQPAAYAAAADFAAQIGPATNRVREYQEALWNLGWWVPPSVPMSFFMEVGAMANRGQKTALRHRMVTAGRSRSAMQMMNSWMDLASFRSRRRFLLDGVRDLRNGRYRVSIPTLLPMLEGISIDALAPGTTATSPLPALSSSPALGTAAGDAIVETVTLLWARQDFSSTPASSRRLNRHLILHGRSTGYGTAENAVKVLFALDQLASMVRRASGSPRPGP